MKNNLITTAVIVALLASGIGFFAGMKYQQSKTPSFMRNMPADFQERMVNRTGERPAGMQGLKPVSGEVIEKDEDSITVKLQDDSSKIILLTDTSSINKTEEGSSEDLTEGTQIVVFGQENSDGSITAQNIQIGNSMFRELPEEN